LKRRLAKQKEGGIWKSFCEVAGHFVMSFVQNIFSFICSTKCIAIKEFYIFTDLGYTNLWWCSYRLHL